jgi:starch-binding outer membrane protein SusE/F
MIMNNIGKIFMTAAISALAFAACSKLDNLKKEEPLPVYKQGVSPVLSASTTTVAAALADTSRSVVTFNWTNPGYANDSATTKYVLELDTAASSFATPVRFTYNGQLSQAMTGRELNAVLLQLGFNTGVARTMDVRLLSSYANNNERYASNTVKLTVTPFADPSVFSGSSSNLNLELANAANTAIQFNWSAAFTGYSGGITYTLQYDSTGKDFTSLNEITIADSSQANKRRFLTQAELNAAAIAEGVVPPATGSLQFRVKAVTATGIVVFSNPFTVAIGTYITVQRYYMPGGYQSASGQGDDWTPQNAPEFVRDTRTGAINKLYYTYMYLPANTGFKITLGRSWDENYGGTGGNLERNGADLSVPTDGYYRISIDMANLKYDIREGRMGFVGGATGAGWTPPNVFPNYAMGLAGTNLFLGITDLTSDGWKLIDNNEWNNGDLTVTNTRSYGTSAASGSPLQVNGDNFANPAAAGKYRVIWDGRSRDEVTYTMMLANEMRVVGNGLDGVAEWTPSVSPTMNYSGNGIWTLTVNLIGGKEIKFLAGNDWGAFDYEDAGDTGTPGERKIKWEGGGNFNTPATSGTYTITLNEITQKVTIL